KATITLWNIWLSLLSKTLEGLPSYLAYSVLSRWSHKPEPHKTCGKSIFWMVCPNPQAKNHTINEEGGCAKTSEKYFCSTFSDVLFSHRLKAYKKFEKHANKNFEVLYIPIAKKWRKKTKLKNGSSDKVFRNNWLLIPL